jgi:amidase
MTAFREYASYDALGLAELVDRGEVTPSALVEEAIARIVRLNPSINAVVHTMYDRARRCAKEAEGSARADQGRKRPFIGVPFLLKDLLQTVRGVPTNSGSRFFQGRTYLEDGTLGRRWAAAGLIALGKTNTPELGILPVTEPALFGPTRNPWNLERTSGGSSGGSGAAVAAGIVPIASGGDGGGSIRIPASCCGIFGLKPSRARMPLGPYHSEGWNGLVVEHVLSRSVRDSAAAFDATEGLEPGSPYAAPPLEGSMLEACARDPRRLRIAFHADPAMPGAVHPDCHAALRDAVRLCESLGHVVEERHPGHEPQELARHMLTIVAVNVAADIVEGERELGKTARPTDFEASTWVTGMLGRSLRALDLELAIRGLMTESRRLARLYDGYDVVLTPTLARPPLVVGELQPKGLEALALRALSRMDAAGILERVSALDAAVDRVFEFTPFTPLANFTGAPSMSVPLYWNAEGLPIGSMFTAKLGGERLLFELAGQLERARPWRDRRPPLYG